MRLLLIFLILNSINGFGQSVLVAKPAGKDVSQIKPILIPGEEYEIIKVDADKYWLKSRSGDSLTTSANYSQDNSINGPDIQQYFWPKATCDSMKRRYGTSVWKKIVSGKVVIGWSQDLCRFCLGEPTKINLTLAIGGSTEQWVYPTSHLYFKNGRLTTIRN